MAKTAKKPTKNTKTAAAAASVKPKAAVSHGDAHANAMDYSEHDKTYELFLSMSRWTTIFCIALLLAMMVGFFAGGGLIGGIIVFIILMIASFFIL